MDWVDVRGTIVGLEIATNWAGWDDSRATFGDDWVAFNFANLSFAAGDFLDATFLTSHDVDVPEPGTLALLGLGLAGMGMTRRKKKV